MFHSSGKEKELATVWIYRPKTRWTTHHFCFHCRLVSFVLDDASVKEIRHMKNKYQRTLVYGEQ